MKHLQGLKWSYVALVFLALALVSCSLQPVPVEEPRVFFVEPSDGATVESPVQLRFGAENFTVEPVGDDEVHEGAGHLHLTINADCVAPGEEIARADPHIHFGDGSTEIELALEPGTHRLCRQAADGQHIALAGGGMTEEITLTVQ